MCRDEIAGCSEKAYDSLSLADAKKILMFASDQELQAYVLDVSTWRCLNEFVPHIYGISISNL